MRGGLAGPLEKSAEGWWTTCKGGAVVSWLVEAETTGAELGTREGLGAACDDCACCIKLEATTARKYKCNINGENREQVMPT